MPQVTVVTDSESSKKKSKTKSGSFTSGFILMGLGLIFLLSNLDLIPDLSDTWPLILIVIGAALVIGALRDRRRDDASGTAESSSGEVPPAVS